jgi:two-component system, OmpR family, copper resistance phosphate regulon response regulator CusR
VQILIVEDEPKLATALQEGIEGEGYSVRLCLTGQEGFYLVQAQPFDLMILDIMLPGHDGLEILETLRRRGIRTPVLILTCRDAIEDRVRGLDHGADDYLVKPFAFAELLARIRVLLRRGQPEDPRRFKLDDLELDASRRVASRSGQSIDLSAREFEILEYLFLNRGRIVSREMLALDIRKITSRQVPIDNVIDVQMTSLRRKIDGQFERKLLQTVRGVGYSLREEERPRSLGGQGMCEPA